MEKYKLKKILIDGTPFEYKEFPLSYATSSPITLEDATNLLAKVKKLFDAKKLDFYLAYGTLLGAVREKGLIPGDEDVDVFVRDEKLLYSMLPYLEDNGLHLIRLIKGNTYSFRLGDYGYIDVYILRPLKYAIWMPYCYSLCNMVTPKKYFKEYQDIVFLGVSCKCPKNPEKLLAFWYGNSWRTPIRGHKFFYEVKSAYYWHSRILPLIKSIILYDIWCDKAKKMMNR